MAVVLRCQRRGRKNLNVFRVVASDERAKSDGRVVEILGVYTPSAKDATKQLTLDVERAKYWVGVGAQITDTVKSLLKRSGVELPKRKRNVRNRPSGKIGRGGVTRKPARFGMTKKAKSPAAPPTASAKKAE